MFWVFLFIFVPRKKDLKENVNIFAENERKIKCDCTNKNDLKMINNTLIIVKISSKKGNIKIINLAV